MKNIVLCIDNNYVMPCGITLTSLFENNDGKNIVIHIIGMNLSESAKNILKDTVDHYQSSIIFYNIDESYLNQFNFVVDTVTYLNVSAYIRLFLTEIISSDIDKILYLDSDIMVVDKIDDLYKISLENYSVGGVIDDISFDKNVYSRLQYPEKFLYINSGIILINLKYWRENDVLKKFIEFGSKMQDTIFFHDQDIINGTLHSSTLHLPIKYNVHSFYYLSKSKSEFNLSSDLTEARNNAVIVHFTMTPKPWFKGCMHPRLKEYLEYKRKSLWKDIPLTWEKNTSFNDKIKYYKRVVLYSLGLKKRKYIIVPE